jgi:TolB-like protein
MITAFLRELKRRRVLRTASLYVLGAWIALQVVEVLSGAGLPPSTMRNLLIALSFAFPLALIVGWFFDISKDGIEKTDPLKAGEQLPKLKFIDHMLLIGLLFVVAVDVYILSFPPPEDILVVNSASQQRTIAVLGFEDLELTKGSDPIGGGLAGELRSSLTRTAGLRVLGPATSKMLRLSGENKYTMANELFVTALLLGEVLLDGGHIEIRARLVGVPNGNEIWSNTVDGLIGDAISLQEGLIRQVIGAIAPSLNPDPVQGPWARVGECSEVYDLYLRGKSLTKDRGGLNEERLRGLELLYEAVSIDGECALAWDAIATASLTWSVHGFAKAGAAARRALELNDSLPGAWTILAEIAEEEERWTESEENFLHAIYVDPTNARTNQMYGEALLARGRVRDGLHHVLEAYRYDPASRSINWHATLAAKMAGEGDLAIKHALIRKDIKGQSDDLILDALAEGYLLKGETERALEAYLEMEGEMPGWFLDCVRFWDAPELLTQIIDPLREATEQFKAGEDGMVWQVIRCATWIGEPDIIFDILNSAEDLPTELKFFLFFFSDASELRQDPRFHDQVVDTGLLEYWRQWGWSDYCEPDGDGFRCD